MVASNKQLAKLSSDERRTLLTQAREALEASSYTAEALQDTLNGLLATTGQKPGILFSLIRLGVSWAPFSPALNDTLAVLGKETVLRRLDQSIASIQ